VDPHGVEAETAALTARDQADSSRAIGPLQFSPDAIPLDTTSMSFPDQVRFIVELARPIFGPR
jgi:cytidylate kinase